MDILYAVILGVVEGITEFLPISSTGHLIISQDLIGYRDDAKVFTVVVQFGAILAAAWHFRSDLSAIIRGVVHNDASMRLFARNVALGLLPSVILGLLLELTIGIPSSLVLIATTLILGGVVFLLIESRPHTAPDENGAMRYNHITTKRSLLVGLGQCLALIPGVSRSGATIMTGLLLGLDRKTATIFSFYLSIPIMLGASAIKLMNDHSEIQSITGGMPALVAGTVASFISALIVIKWLLRYVQTHTFKPFAYYRIALGLLILVVLIIHS